MNKSLLSLAAVFAVLFISACSGGDRCEDAGGCQTYNGYCVDGEYRICIPSMEEECLLLTKGHGFSEWLYFYRTCPSDYDDAPKACYVSGWECELMAPPYSETDCRNENGSFMDFGTCLRTHGIWDASNYTYGSCTVSGECYSNISQSDCSSARGSFVRNGTCPPSGGNNYGSCTWPGYACIENLPRYECDESDGEVFVSNGTCSTTSFPYCANYGDCDRIGGSYISSKSECFYEDGFLANLKFCQEYGFDIEGIDY